VAHNHSCVSAGNLQRDADGKFEAVQIEANADTLELAEAEDAWHSTCPPHASIKTDE